MSDGKKEKRRESWILWTIVPFTISIILLIIFQQFIEVRDLKIQQAIGSLAYGVGMVITNKIL